MFAVITKELALRIVQKLGAKIETGKKAHDIAYVEHEGKRIAWFGIRRGSKKDMGHDHVPEALYLRPSQARLLGQCPMKREEWLAIMADKGII